MINLGFSKTSMKNINKGNYENLTLYSKRSKQKEEANLPLQP